MAEIEKEIIGDKGVTVFKVKGEMLCDQIIDEITRFYAKDLTRYAVWDFSCAEGKHVTANEVQKIAKHAKKFGHLRSDGKTAFVMSSSLAYGLGRMYDSFAQVNNHPVKHGIFRNYNEAISWIEGQKRSDIIPGEPASAPESNPRKPWAAIT